MTTHGAYLSPDGVLRLVVRREKGDITIGFEGHPWHTHGDVVAGERELLGEPKCSPEEAARKFVEDLLAGRVAVCAYRLRGQIQDVAATYLPAADDPYLQPGEEGDTLESCGSGRALPGW